ncbi:MAG: division/cell wall cluster transcriptional repressor MraZ [Bacteroidetes bacterium QH_10_64_19]|jgi:MraZ protein|nr:MAG: division/cell wall cluster transcriptional repressor MraZ [Bacteroidetes bacterium QH_10_64_19]PSQ74915.1 MAG: division/cell wall cluster transcriptional repressor MraZ [Bacteroidetes bacterium QH_9_64_21]
MGFKGQAEYSVDSKGRVAIPAKMRKSMSPQADETFTITRGFEDCIFLYPKDEWAEIEEEIDDLNMYDREVRNFVRIIMRWANEVSLDGQGRISIPNPLLDFAELDGSALIIGAFNHIEIWNPEEFDGYLNEQPEDYETLAESVMSM